MEPQKSPRELAADLISQLVPDWRPTREHVLWTIRIVIALFVLQALFVLIGAWLWEVIAHYVNPRTPSDRKDLVNIFVIIGAGVVGLLTAMAAVGNLYISRRNLQNAQATMRQQRDLEEQRAQEDALQSYFEQMGGLLTEQELIDTDHAAVRQLAQAQSHTVLARLDGSRKGALLRFLHVARLIRTNDPMQALLPDAARPSTSKPIVGLSGADLGGAVLREAELYWADLSRANLSRAKLSSAKLSHVALVRADLSGADLSGAVLIGAYLDYAVLSGADLRGANLSGADLSWAKGVTNEELEQQATALKEATMPNGQKYEDWLRDREGREENGKNSGP